MNIKLPSQVEQILNIFEENGFEAYIVGGCVRDSILGVEPKDWDICTSALPEQTLNLFKDFKVIETGLQHGTVTVVIDSMSIEITTYRIDGEYSDNRRPDKVEFTRNLKEDLSRRDFTINAMAYNPKIGLIDYFEGQRGIKNKEIKCVGNPNMRFNEDALRIMRALRFASVLGFNIEDETRVSIEHNKELLHNIAVERIAGELNKLLLGVNVKSILNDYKYVINEFIPEIEQTFNFKQNNPHHKLDVWSHIVESVSNSKPDLIIRLTMLLHDIAKPICYTEENGVGHFYGHPKYSADMAVNILKRLKYETAIINNVNELVSYHDVGIMASRRVIKRLLNKVGVETFLQLLDVKRADIKAQNIEYIDRLNKIDEVKNLLSTILEERQCFSLKDLKINGKDLINIGVQQGKDIGIILNKLVGLVIDDEIENEREVLLVKAKELCRD